MGVVMLNKVSYLNLEKSCIAVNEFIIVVLLQIVLLSSIVFVPVSYAQTVPDFDMKAYKSFLASHQDMSSDQLLSLHPTGLFKQDSPTDYSTSLYFKSLDSLYNFTSDEKTLLGQHGFVVTERIRPQTFTAGFDQIFKADMPLFISTDAILHALHMSYDKILKNAEMAIMIPKLGDALEQIHEQLPVLATNYAQENGMSPSLSDAAL
jgi:hypothetical protein